MREQAQETIQANRVETKINDGLALIVDAIGELLTTSLPVKFTDVKRVKAAALRLYTTMEILERLCMLGKEVGDSPPEGKEEEKQCDSEKNSRS